MRMMSLTGTRAESSQTHRAESGAAVHILRVLYSVSIHTAHAWPARRTR